MADQRTADLELQLSDKERVIQELYQAATERLAIINQIAGSSESAGALRRNLLPPVLWPDDAPAGFADDFTSRNVASWTTHLAKFAGLPNIRGIEIGCWEGRSSVWLLENILQHESSHLTCIEPYPAPTFAGNLSRFRHKVRWMKSHSITALRDLALEDRSMHFAYVDGDHTAPRVLEDAVLVFPLVISGGIIIFDDYSGNEFPFPDRPQTMPPLAVDSFVSIYRDYLKVLETGKQLIVEKL